MTFINYPTPSLNASQSQACHCMGKRPGQPLCPCGMRGLVQRDGRWIRPEQDMGPVMPEAFTREIERTMQQAQSAAGTDYEAVLTIPGVDG